MTFNLNCLDFNEQEVETFYEVFSRLTRRVSCGSRDGTGKRKIGVKEAQVQSGSCSVGTTGGQTSKHRREVPQLGREVPGLARTTT